MALILYLFYVGDDVLKDREGIPIGLMSADDFVQNTGSSLSSYQVTSLNLYFQTRMEQNL